MTDNIEIYRQARDEIRKDLIVAEWDMRFLEQRLKEIRRRKAALQNVIVSVEYVLNRESPAFTE